MAFRLRDGRGLVLLLAGLLAGAPAGAGDGVIEINQTRALAGGVTPGDAPGFPVELNARGSYRLTSNLVISVRTVDVIAINSDDVTLDLNGFTIDSSCEPAGPIIPPGCLGSGSGKGIDADGSRNVTVRNGIVRDMDGFGIDLSTASLVEDVKSVANGGTGIFVGSSSIVRNSLADRNGGHGIVVGSRSTASGNVATLNGRNGILTGLFASHVVGNVASNNGEYGIFASGSASFGYASNVLQSNGSGPSAGGIELGPNLCDGDTIC